MWWPAVGPKAGQSAAQTRDSAADSDALDSPTLRELIHSKVQRCRHMPIASSATEVQAPNPERIAF